MLAIGAPSGVAVNATGDGTLEECPPTSVSVPVDRGFIGCMAVAFRRPDKEMERRRGRTSGMLQSQMPEADVPGLVMELGTLES